MSIVYSPENPILERAGFFVKKGKKDRVKEKRHFIISNKGVFHIFKSKSKFQTAIKENSDKSRKILKFILESASKKSKYDKSLVDAVVGPIKLCESINKNSDNVSCFTAYIKEKEYKEYQIFANDHKHLPQLRQLMLQYSRTSSINTLIKSKSCRPRKNSIDSQTMGLEFASQSTIDIPSEGSFSNEDLEDLEERAWESSRSLSMKVYSKDVEYINGDMCGI